MDAYVPSENDAVADAVDPPRLIVGIGASAGGLESLERLFRHMPVDTGMAFVVVQHLSPDFRSMMDELLSRHTSMPIHIVQQDMPVAANSIYLLPPKKMLGYSAGRLQLIDRTPAPGPPLPVDYFFDSLARHCDQVAAIILSGSGSDGSRGIRIVSAAGGLILSESLATAKFDGMPSSAQATGLVDLVLPPEAMGAALVRYLQNPALNQKDLVGEASRNASSDHGFRRILRQLHESYRLDFGEYKESTVLRRLQRRMNLCEVASMQEYSNLLERDAEECQQLYRDLLIGVTEFFRDPEVFEILRRTVIPDLLAKLDTRRGLRVWVAGCATGEEAYSLAIVCREAMRASGRVLPLKVFATDVDLEAVESAGRGVYAASALQSIPPEIRGRYFAPRGTDFQITAELRQSIIFAPHNLLRDAPFTDLDLVSCRNLLIYLKDAAQQHAQALFHHGLRIGGLMLLGSSESPRELESEFETLHERARIYRKKRQVRLLSNFSTTNVAASQESASSPVAERRGPPTRGATATSRNLYRSLANAFIPPSVVVDSARMVIDTFGGAEKLLHFPSGQPSLDVLELVPRELRATLSGALGRAAKEQLTVRMTNVRLGEGDESAECDLTITPIQPAAQNHFFVISLTLRSTAARAEPQRETAPGELVASREQIRQLEIDLRDSQENLRSTIEALETSNEELQATNEELIASNEELQSTNEELHSLNEELQTVNSEYQRKIEELAEVNHDMQHLLENTDVATVFLDRDLRIRRFTSRVREVFELLDQDVGRPLWAFASKLQLPDLRQRLNQVLQSGEGWETETRTVDGTSYLMRLLPYRTGTEVEGVVMMWVDVSSLEFLRGRLRWLSAIVESTDDAIIGLDLDGAITSWNRGAEKLYGYTADEVVGKGIDLIVPEDRRSEIAEYHRSILRGESLRAIDTARRHKDGHLVNVSLTISPVVNAYGNVIGVSKIARDIGLRIEMEQAIRRQVRQREQFLAMLSHELRNPLNAMSGAAQLLTDARIAHEQLQFAKDTVVRQVAVMTHLLADLLDVARISENRINLKFELLDLRDLVPLVHETVASVLIRHQCQLRIEQPDEPLWVRGDATRLVQIQVNLLHNAAKFSPPHSTVRWVLRKENGQVVLEVIDQGRGLAADQLHQVFEPFLQLAESRDQSEGGLGIGLSLARSLVELHGGRIFALSDGLDQGSTFRVCLPEASRENVEPSEESRSVSATESQKVHPLRIVVIEDLEDNLEVLRLLLELDGHQVWTARDGERGLALIQEHRPDLALVDIGLPGISGYDVAKRARERTDDSSEPMTLIALTGRGQQSDVEQALNSGFDAHLVKPLDPDRLQEVLRKVQVALSSKSKAAQPTAAD